LPDVHPFAVAAIRDRHQAVVHAAPIDAVLALLQAPYEPTVALGLLELERRFDPANPDFDLLHRLLSDDRPLVLQTGHRWLQQSAKLWVNNPARVMAWIILPDGPTRVLVADLVIHGPRPNSDVRAILADAALNLLRGPEPTPGLYESLARMAVALLSDELNRRLTLRQLTAMIATGSAAAQMVAGHLLARRPAALAELGLEYVATLGGHAVASVRVAAHELLRGSPDVLRADPSILFVLAESEWADTRTVAFTLLRSLVDWERAGLDPLTGLLDSNRTDVQDFGIELVRKYLPVLPLADLVDRLVEHPHPNMRRFTIELLAEHLPARLADLPKLDGFFRTAVLDLWPSRAVKRKVLEFVASRGLQDAEQASVAAEFLAAVVRTQNRADFERALEALVRIRLAFPEVENAVTITGGVA
jgi:hypothetical protein